MDTTITLKMCCFSTVSRKLISLTREGRDMQKVFKITELLKDKKSGLSDGPLSRGAQISCTRGATLDTDGSVIFTDFNRECIRKLYFGDDPGLFTITGNGESGSKDGDMSEAQFRSLTGCVCTKNRVIYAAEDFPKRLRSIDLNTKQVSTLDIEFYGKKKVSRIIDMCLDDDENLICITKDVNCGDVITKINLKNNQMTWIAYQLRFASKMFGYNAIGLPFIPLRICYAHSNIMYAMGKDCVVELNLNSNTYKYLYNQKTSHLNMGVMSDFGLDAKYDIYIVNREGTLFKIYTKTGCIIKLRLSTFIKLPEHLSSSRIIHVPLEK
eukprot:CAMPEP_0168529878 /NCGR_PEP_ID=MMETSP0405-20121227/14229_1 /TAXON_ID=498012 /ORGANISM="Trichosphaerium sp, Strain Am-I-7 wt" /LENGTH=324 /DNA_ID=CAMNT_0008553803 /DNA_START=1 /DNA_END=972 /DNA_ORIENTATION=+